MRIVRKTLLNGEPDQFEDKSLTYHYCCDCALTHATVTDINPKTKIATLKWYRDDHETQRQRKRLGIVLYRRKKPNRK